MNAAKEAVPPARTAHVPVMLDEVVAALQPRPGEVYLDCTLGLGGHAEAMAARLAPGGQVIGLDRDPATLAAARARLGALPLDVRWTFVRAPFGDARHALVAHGIERVDLVLADLGVSSMHLDQPERGFGYRHRQARLDLRMDPEAGPSAAERIAAAGADELTRVLRDYGEVVTARALAAELVATKPQTIGELLDAVATVERREPRKALWARVLQALRIWVNDELGQLERLLATLPRIAAAGARVAILSYHSLEDRMVKHTFRAWEQGPSEPAGMVSPLMPKTLGRRLRVPLKPSTAEVAANPRARSARLRAFLFAEAAGC